MFIPFAYAIFSDFFFSLLFVFLLLLRLLLLFAAFLCATSTNDIQFVCATVCNGNNIIMNSKSAFCYRLQRRSKSRSLSNTAVNYSALIQQQQQHSKQNQHTHTRNRNTPSNPYDFLSKCVPLNLWFMFHFLRIARFNCAFHIFTLTDRFSAFRPSSTIVPLLLIGNERNDD